MAKERKTREYKKSSIDTSKLKNSGFGGDFSSRGEQRLAFAKTLKTESEKIQSQIESEQEKAQQKSLWSSIGGALGGLAFGIATGGLGLAGLAGAAAAGIGTGLGTYVGAEEGKRQAQKKYGKRKDIKSDMFYEKEAEKQNLAFTEYDRELDKSIQNRALAAGAMAAAFVGGGEIIKKIKEGKSARDAAKVAKASKEARGAMQGYIGKGEDAVLSDPKSVDALMSKVPEGADFVLSTDISGIGKADLASNVAPKPSIVSESGAAMSLDDVLYEGTNEQLADALSGDFKLAPSGPNAFADSSLSLTKSPLNLKATSLNSQLAAVTPETTQAVPTMMSSYLSGVQEMASSSMQKTLLAGGAMSLYNYRPELESLRNIQFATNVKPYSIG